eukprot:403361506
MNTDTLTIVILNDQTSNNPSFLNYSQSKSRHDLEGQKQMLNSFFSVKEDTRTYLCCLKYKDALINMLMQDILSLVTLFWAAVSLNDGLFLIFALIIFVIPRVGLFLLNYQFSPNYEIFKFMYNARLVTVIMWIMFYAVISYIALYSSDLVMILFVQIPATFFTVIDLCHICVLKEMLDSFQQ